MTASTNKKAVRRSEPPAALVEWKGVTPAHQARSEATYHALIKAGRKALANQSFEEMTIAALARSAGTSVGAFYGRFENKQAYFSAIQETVVAEIAADVSESFEALDAAQGSAVEFLGLLAETLAGIFRNNKGLYRAAVKDASALPHIWTPFKRLGWAIASMAAAKLTPRLAELGKPASEHDVRVAIQLMNGMLVNATINDPGPIHLEDDEMVSCLKRMLFAFLGVEQAPPPRRSQASIGRRATKKVPA
jgi:AcrR family transcriptional regulator